MNVQPVVAAVKHVTRRTHPAHLILDVIIGIALVILLALVIGGTLTIPDFFGRLWHAVTMTAHTSTRSRP
jgi:hypothetical protein